MKPADVVHNELEQADSKQKVEETISGHEKIQNELLPTDFKAYIQQHETELLSSALDKYRFNQRKAADALGLSYHQMRAYLRKYPSLNNHTE